LVADYNFADLIKCFEEQKKIHQIEADRLNGSACYVNLLPQHIEVIKKVNKKFESYYGMKVEFSFFSCNQQASHEQIGLNGWFVHLYVTIKVIKCLHWRN
ncbi:unnamed protein product, partial [Schistosoma margrebowiei]|uniref:Uncharacterized protein n=1 Tax=Schistosoma margrebowiei TaxID=48269 RepID=A0AA85AIJ3_9TREM